MDDISLSEKYLFLPPSEKFEYQTQVIEMFGNREVGGGRREGHLFAEVFRPFPDRIMNPVQSRPANVQTKPPCRAVMETAVEKSHDAVSK